jgi:hypothetical protein
MKRGCRATMLVELVVEIQGCPQVNSIDDFPRGVDFFKDMSIMESRLRWILKSITVNHRRILAAVQGNV